MCKCVPHCYVFLVAASFSAATADMWRIVCWGEQHVRVAQTAVCGGKVRCAWGVRLITVMVAPVAAACKAFFSAGVWFMLGSCKGRCPHQELVRCSLDLRGPLAYVFSRGRLAGIGALCPRCAV